MLVKLELGLLPGIEDVQGNKTARKINHELGIPVESVRIIKCFTISGITGMQQQELLEKQALYDP
ncbi:MAG: hypothetical protein ABR533_00935, partial [Desulfonatronovibrio sp.]